MARRKKGELTRLAERLDELVRLFTRKRDRYTCQWCGGHDKLTAAHIIPHRGKNQVLRWAAENVVTLCYRCHLEGVHKDFLAAAEWFHKKYPDKYRMLKLLAKKHKVYTTDERKQMIEKLEERIRDCSTTR